MMPIRPINRCANRSCLAEIKPGESVCASCFPRLPFPVAHTLNAKRERGSLDVGYVLAVRQARTWLESLPSSQQAAA